MRRSSRMTAMFHLVLLFLVGLVAGFLLSRLLRQEGFEDAATCGSCGNPSPCGCSAPRPVRPAGSECKQPDMNKYVLKSSIPPCPAVPDLSNYMLKSECPPVPDLSNYVLKSSIPKQSPVILDCSKCNAPKGECPPCPRPRCPEVKCPEPTTCPACAPCPRQNCPPAKVKCKAEDVVSDRNSDSMVRPYVAPLNFNGFGIM